MRKLIYMHMVSLDGFIDVDGPHKEPDWASGSEELNRHFNEIEESIDAHLYGRRIFEQLATFWPVADANPLVPEYVARYARIWREKPKVVFSRTLRQVEWNARLVSEDVPGEIARLKEEPGRDLLLFGANLASGLIPLGLVDEIRAYVNPVLLGGGKPMFPPLDQIRRLRLLESRTFDSGVVLLHYRV